MFIIHLALGGCLSVPPVTFGLTADTGGHIAYVLDAAMAQAALPGVDRVSIVTRLFEDAARGGEYGLATQRVAAGVTIDRIATRERRYLEKDALAADLPALTEAFCAHLAALPVLPSVIHAHFADAARIAGVARRRFGIPFVYTPHALGIDKPGLADATMAARIGLERAAIAAADAIIVSTRDEAERQVAAYGVAGSEARLACVPPGVPQNSRYGGAPVVAESLGTWLTEPGKPMVLAIARPVRKKNLVGLVRGFAMTAGLAERANLVILAGQHGHGVRSDEERAVVGALRLLCEGPGLRGRVALPPRHGAADVHALYGLAAAGGVFVNPALHEPFGLTLIEAAAMGVPVVATCHGGPVDIIGAIGHGVLVDPRDDAAIGAACLRILGDAALHASLSQAGRDGAALFDWSRYAARSVSLYASLGGVDDLPRFGLLEAVGA